MDFSGPSFESLMGPPKEPDVSDSQLEGPQINLHDLHAKVAESIEVSSQPSVTARHAHPDRSRFGWRP